jgi:hypothetical protein
MYVAFQLFLKQNQTHYLMSRKSTLTSESTIKETLKILSEASLRIIGLVIHSSPKAGGLSIK